MTEFSNVPISSIVIMTVSPAWRVNSGGGTMEVPVPELTTVLTGTSIVPPPEFTLQAGDTVIITIDEIGTLENSVIQV
jgi:fumarylacetoacetate (FAA) hydrolase family protein